MYSSKKALKFRKLIANDRDMSLFRANSTQLKVSDYCLIT